MARVFTVDEAAEYLHVTPYTIRKWLRKGKIPGRKIGRLYRILEAELEAALHAPAEDVPELPESEELARKTREEAREQERRRKLEQWRSLSREEKLKRIDAVMDKFANARVSSEDIIRERREEVEREERRWKERCGQ